jgi:hypothetical protein
LHCPVGDKPLEGLNRKALIKLYPVAVLFTGMMADPSCNAGKGIGLEEEMIGIQVFLLPDPEEKSFNVISNGAA